MTGSTRSQLRVARHAAAVLLAASLVTLATAKNSPSDDSLDIDLDGVGLSADNCPDHYNPGQEDTDNDGVGDACDPDMDGDGLIQAEDNCPKAFNPDQSDIDGDGVGDRCDDDIDGDGVPNSYDNCPLLANEEQMDLDGDGLGDLCDDDVDGDGIVNWLDTHPTDPRVTAAVFAATKAVSSFSLSAGLESLPKVDLSASRRFIDIWNMPGDYLAAKVRGAGSGPEEPVVVATLEVIDAPGGPAGERSTKVASASAGEQRSVDAETPSLARFVAFLGRFAAFASSAFRA